MKLRSLFDIDSLKEEVEELEKETLVEGFWDDSQKAQEFFDFLNHKKGLLNSFQAVEEPLEEIEIMEELEDLGEEDFSKEIEDLVKGLSKKVEDLKTLTLLTGEYDGNNAIMQINAGAGGLEAQDWTEMLLRMYTRWLDDHSYQYEITDYHQDTAGGIKSVTLQITGNNSYGFLKSEKGVHRLVRISPFDSNNKRHTSFASVDVYPSIEEEEVEIDEKDLKIDTYRSSGAGGQHVNNTDSAVRITHLPTGITVQCQSERSQITNRRTAMAMLASRLHQIKEEERLEKIEDIQGKHLDIAWGSQIRSYIFHPYQMVKDHRTKLERSDIDQVMDGDLDDFMDAFLVMEQGD